MQKDDARSIPKPWRWSLRQNPERSEESKKFPELDFVIESKCIRNGKQSINGIFYWFVLKPVPVGPTNQKQNKRQQQQCFAEFFQLRITIRKIHGKLCFDTTSRIYFPFIWNFRWWNSHEEGLKYFCEWNENKRSLFVFVVVMLITGCS